MMPWFHRDGPFRVCIWGPLVMWVGHPGGGWKFNVTWGEAEHGIFVEIS